MTTAGIVEVFRSNFRNSVQHINQMLQQSYNIITLDTAFPGFLHVTSRQASSNQRYDDFRYNVERTKLIQVGIALANEYGYIGGTWQFNLSGFNPACDEGAPHSVLFLGLTGIDFNRNMAEGVPVNEFGSWMRGLLASLGPWLKWITFNGLYDFGYVLLILNEAQTLPATSNDFIEALKMCFGLQLFDVKVIAEGNGLFDGKKGEVGLSRLAELMGVERSAGVAHQTGSDSLLTAKLFAKMRDRGLNVHGFQSCIYGINRSDAQYPSPIIMSWINSPPPPMIFYQWTPLGFMAYPGGLGYRF